MRIAAFSALLLCSNAAFAQTEKEQLREIVIANGSNEFGGRRHAVELEDCTLNTFWWKKYEGEWVLWTSLWLDLRTVEIGQHDFNGDLRWFMGVEGTPELIVMTFASAPGSFIRHEKSVHRRKPEVWEPSPRGDGTTHFFQDQTSVALIHEGPGVIDKASAFTNALIDYRDKYCRFLG